MSQKVERTKAGGEQVRVPADPVFKPAVSAEDLKADTEQDPEGAEEFVALIRALRKEESRPVAL